jgi:aminoglycoside phosphotransferase family enzyme
MLDQKLIVDALLRPDAYPDTPGKIEIIQTHISFVFLTEKYVFKMKKAVNFGFLDFSTIDKRKLYCDKELELNRRLCPSIYLEVLPITRLGNIIKIKGGGEIIDYALKMKRLPQDRIMTLLLQENKVAPETIDEIAQIVANFHAKAKATPEINQFGSLRIIKINWDENFEQTVKYINQTIPKEEFDYIQSKINKFFETQKTLLDSRIAHGRIRDCHGDLHSGNIFITDEICVFDAIEFNDRFRYSDVASDVAFLAMDLDFQQKTHLAKRFVDKYVEVSKDKQLTELLPFYKCYRAYVRGKVVSFRLDDKNIPANEKEAAIKEAQAYFKLAFEYAKSL